MESIVISEETKEILEEFKALQGRFCKSIEERCGSPPLYEDSNDYIIRRALYHGIDVLNDYFNGKEESEYERNEYPTDGNN